MTAVAAAGNRDAIGEQIAHRWLREGYRVDRRRTEPARSPAYQRGGVRVTCTRLRNLTGTPPTVAG